MTPNEFTHLVRRNVITNKNFNKIFCIGYNKTGTTTLETLLKLYGYILPNQQDQTARLAKSMLQADYTDFSSFCERYDAFQDLPFSQANTYVAADALFPNSKFILTERDSGQWFKSMLNFHTKKYGINDFRNLTEDDVVKKFVYLYPGFEHASISRMLSKFHQNQRTIMWEKLFDRDYYIDIYERRNEEIKRYFMNAPDKLLVIDITNERDTSRICEFLNIPIKYTIKMPHENKT